MAYFEKRKTAKGEVRWRAQIRRENASPLNKTFRTKAAAESWARIQESALTGEGLPLGKHTLSDAMQRYARDVSPDRAGGRWERIRLLALERDGVARVKLSLLTSDRLALWRNTRLEQVSPGTVKREMNLLQSVLERARVEWKWIRTNPMRDVKKPPDPPARRRGVTDAELAKLAEHANGAGYKEVVAGFELGIESGMRAGEMWGLEPEQIDGHVARLDKTKNGDRRDVALSARAAAIIEELLADGRPTLFTISNAVRDALFRKLRDLAGLPDLHFHDSRSEAVSRLSKQLPIMELADQIGHRDLSSLLSYYKPSAADRATRLHATSQTKPSPRKRSSAGARRPPRG